jgi:flagellar hook-length control protein FliK
LNPALATSLLKSGNSIENNALPSPDGVSNELSNELFAGEFSTAMEDILAADGKLKPLDVATLKQLEIQQITELEELSGVQLPPQLLSEAIELQEKQPLFSDSIILQAADSIEEVNLLGHPDAITLLKANMIDGDSSENNLFNNQTAKSASLIGRELTDVIQQLPLKKESGLSQISSDIDFAQYAKELVTKDTDISKELLIQTNRQEINTTKLLEQFTSIDKPINLINSAANPALKTYSNLDPSIAMLNRIEVPVTQTGWGEAVGNRLMMMINGKMQSANIHLNPAELGPIEIRINVNQEQASVHFVSNNSIVREAIEDAFPRLKEMFTQNGLSLANANVSQQSSQQGSPYSGEQNNTATVFNKESLETADVQINNTNENIIDIGLIDHYV